MCAALAPLQAQGPDAQAAQWNREAAVLLEQERCLEAEARLRRAIRRIEDERGPGAADLAEPLNNLAVVHRKLGRLTDAERAYRRSLAIRVETLGDDHPKTALVRANLARLRQQAGRWDEAERLLVEAIADASRAGAVGVEAAARHNLAALRLKQMRFRAAFEQAGRAVALWRAAGMSADEAKALGLRAEALRLSGKLPAAAAAFDFALIRARNALGPKHPETALIQTGYARTLRKLGHKQRAKRLLAEARDLLHSAPDRAAREHIVDAAVLRRR